MHIAVCNVGSRGDIQPFVALAVGLIEAGHQVKFITTENFAPFLAQYHIPIHPLPLDFQALLEGKLGREMMDSGKNPVAFFSAFQKMTETMTTTVGPAFLDAFKDVDLIVSGNGVSMGLVSFAQKYNIPLVHALLQPMHTTGDFPNPFFPELPFQSSLYNRFTMDIVTRLMWLFLRSHLNRMRREYLDLPRQTYREVMDYIDHSTVLMGFSPQVVSPASDWKASVHVTGYWFLEAVDKWQPPQSLIHFLDAGTRPVYIGFGSMNTEDPQATAQIALDALAKSGQRGIFLTGWGGLSAKSIPETVYMIDSVPHDWLFSRMSAIIHHGGAGTTAAALRAGVPTMVVPFMADQPYWGKRLAALGVSPGVISIKKLNVDNLAAAISRMVSDKSMQVRAAEIGTAIRAENGVAEAVGLISALERGL